jgi:hypothetical protein
MYKCEPRRRQFLFRAHLLVADAVNILVFARALAALSGDARLSAGNS